MSKVKLLIAGMLVSLGAITGVLMTSPQVAAADQPCSTTTPQTFFGFPTWYKGLVNNDCSLKSPSDMGGGEDTRISRYIWTIVLNVLEILLRVLGIIAVGMMIYGGFLYMTSSGVPDRAASGTKTIISAAIGIVLATSAVAIKNIIWTVVAGNQNADGIYTASAQSVLTAALNGVFFVGGTIAVVMIIISGMNYATSSGSPDKMTKAKNTLLYAIIGLVVVIAAYAITRFVEGRFS